MNVFTITWELTQKFKGVVHEFTPTPKRSSITVVGLQPRNDEQWKWTQYVNSIPYTETQSIGKGADDES